MPSPDMEKEEKAEAESDGEENTSIVQEKEEEVRKNDKVKKKDPSLVAQVSNSSLLTTSNYIIHN